MMETKEVHSTRKRDSPTRARGMLHRSNTSFTHLHAVLFSDAMRQIFTPGLGWYKKSTNLEWRSVMNEATSSTVVVWDLPVRIVHWLVVIAVGLSWWSAEERLMDLHRYSGYALLGALVFRIYWGLVGSPTARFSRFVRRPGAVIAYLRDPPAAAAPGHNPLGGWSVMAMLVLLLTQVGLGLFVTDVDGLESGPLSYLVSFDASRELAESHELVFNIILGFIAVHIVAVLFYLIVRRSNLIGAMFTGRRPAHTVNGTVAHVSLIRIWPGVALAALAVWMVART
jgi:cytochrome b